MAEEFTFFFRYVQTAVVQQRLSPESQVGDRIRRPQPAKIWSPVHKLIEKKRVCTNGTLRRMYRMNGAGGCRMIELEMQR